MNEVKQKINVKKLPKKELNPINTIKPKFRRARSRNIEDINRKARGVIYLGHIPHGFFEDEMRAYFNQFGKVTATTVARSNKTGRSKGYGFVEFEDKEVAQIAAETMNNYLMYNKILKCRYIPPEERKGRIFTKTISTSNYPKQKNRLRNLRNKNRSFYKLTPASYMDKTQKKLNEFKKFFADQGIDFSFKIKNESNLSEDGDNDYAEDNTKVASNNDLKSECDDSNDDQLGVLEIDESDSEIIFKTPPQVKKVFKKSLNSPAVPTKKYADSTDSSADEDVKAKVQKTQERANTKKKILKTKPILNESKQKDKKNKLKQKLMEKGLNAKMNVKKKTGKTLENNEVAKTGIANKMEQASNNNSTGIKTRNKTKN